MKSALFSAFLPWIFFSIFYGTTPDSMLMGSLGALILTGVFNLKELKQGFLLPWVAGSFFFLLILNHYYGKLLWLEQHTLVLMNSVLAFSIWISMLFAKPFTLQYARLEVMPIYWRHPLFLKINWSLTAIWALLLTLVALPGAFIPEPQLLDSWFWSYGWSIIAILLGLIASKKLPPWLIGRNFWTNVKHLPEVKNPYLEGGFAPVHDEVELEDLKIEGYLPLNLNGMYVRNGPNPFFSPYTYSYPIDGDGMVHQMKLAHGWAGYKNRFVATKGLMAEKKAGKALYGGVQLPLMPDPKYVVDEPVKDSADVHVAVFGKQLLAFYETSPAYLLNEELETLGEWQPVPDATQPFKINAHHRRDPETGHIYAFTYDLSPPYLKFYEFDSEGKLLATIPINKAHPTMLHDFVLTKNYWVVFDVPVIFDSNSPEMLSYHKEQPVQILLIGRKHHTVTRITAEHFYLWHFVNAYEQEDKIIVDFVHHEYLEFNPLSGPDAPKQRGPRLYRGTIDLAAQTYQHGCLCDLIVEFPTYALRYTGQPYRYAYCCARSAPEINRFDTILKYDFVTGNQELFSFGQDAEVDEAIFVPEEGASAEDHGYLMLYVYHQNTDTSDFVLLNAAKPKEKPIAVVKLGRRVPHGLHGSWIPR